MRILVLGAGATGGYFGGRLAAAGRDVTFLVRPRRAAELARDGLVITSPVGDVRTPVATVTADRLGSGYDVVLLTCKAYDLDAAIDAIRPALHGAGVVLPLLNGMRHLDVLDSAFGQARVLGGLAKITATLADGTIHHLKPIHTLTYGARRADQRPICDAIAAAWSGCGFDVEASDDIAAAMWEKWVLIAGLAGATCLMRSALCDILAEPGGRALIEGMIDEAAVIATASGKAPRPAALDGIRELLTDAASAMAASMLRDLEAGQRTEVDHVLGDLIARGARIGVAAPLLALARLHIAAATRRRAREG